jgi:hypothetical protein
MRVLLSSQALLSAISGLFCFPCCCLVHFQPWRLVPPPTGACGIEQKSALVTLLLRAVLVSDDVVNSGQSGPLLMLTSLAISMRVAPFLDSLAGALGTDVVSRSDCRRSPADDSCVCRGCERG